MRSLWHNATPWSVSSQTTTPTVSALTDHTNRPQEQSKIQPALPKYGFNSFRQSGGDPVYGTWNSSLLLLLYKRSGTDIPFSSFSGILMKSSKAPWKYPWPTTWKDRTGWVGQLSEISQLHKHTTVDVNLLGMNCRKKESFQSQKNKEFHNLRSLRILKKTGYN